MTLTDPASVPSGRRSRLPLLIAILVVLLLGLTVLVYVLARGHRDESPKAVAAAPKTFPVAGNVNLQPGQYVRQDMQFKSPCWGVPGLDDVRGGAQVTVTDATGKTVGVGALRTGEMHGDPANPHCLLGFTVSGVPAGGKFYGVEIAHRGVVRYPEDKARQLLTLTVG